MASSDNGNTPEPSGEETSNEYRATTNYKLEGYKAGLKRKQKKTSYSDAAANEQWKAGYSEGVIDSADLLGILRPFRWSISLIGMLFLTIFTWFVYTVSKPHGVYPPNYDPRLSEVYPDHRTTPTDLSGIEMRVDKLASMIAETCRTQISINPARTSEVQTAVTSEQRPLFSAAIGGVLDNAARAGKIGVKEALDLKTKLVDATIDVSKDVVKKTADALIGESSKKDESNKTLPGNIQITVTQNNAAPTSGGRGPNQPKSNVCAFEKK